MDMAYKAGMDVINLSLGSFGGWEETVLSRVASSIVSKGVHGKQKKKGKKSHMLMYFIIVQLLLPMVISELLVYSCLVLLQQAKMSSPWDLSRVSMSLDTC